MHVRCSLTPRPIAWIPDFQHRALPEFFTAEEIRQRDRFYGAMLAQRHDIVLSSEHARADALCYYGTPAARLHVLHFATVADPAWFKDAAPQLRRPLPDQYLMVCNQFWAHKDHGTLFEAVHLLAEQGLDVHVVCTGATEDYRRPEYFQQLQARIRSWGLESHIHILGMIAREEQIRLMRGASAIVQPSLFEGWSTVLEDARALGVPVIASDFPVHLEQNLPGALYFRRGDAADCARAIADHVARRREPQAQPKPREHAERVLGFARAFMDIVNT
jgi:glycosyltransferase involved in cell wall biosynthesis